MRPPKDNFKKETEALNMINMQGVPKMLFKVFFTLKGFLRVTFKSKEAHP